MKKALVAYFSVTGTTKKVAEKLAKAAGADIFEITPKTPYTAADLDWMNKRARSTVEMNDKASRPEITGMPATLTDYDTVFIGYPVWWYVAPTTINTFLERGDFAGKKIILFATSGGSGFGKTVERLKGSAPGAEIREGKILNGNPSEALLSDWVKSLGIR